MKNSRDKGQERSKKTDRSDQCINLRLSADSRQDKLIQNKAQPRHVTVKLLKTKNTEQVLKAIQRGVKKHVICRRTMIRIIIDLLETVKARRQ